ncbi:DNA adenine methylase [Thermosynechococcus sp.]|uniref:DNA adenine methylase n=1 Tax=Thermosynechococcus sp. TaxID=2814275 RepID=UPI00391E01B5
MIEKQLSLFSDDMPLPRPVNVASVPQRSPFRYPGGKTWFVPTFRNWMASLKEKPRLLVEPFAGGGIISLTALFENLVDQVVMVELDEEVAAVWETILNGETEWLADRILNFTITRENIEKELQKTPSSKRERAFQTILKNRTLHGGILAEGSRFVRYGEKGKGISSRWYPKTLAQRLRNLNHIASRIDFRCDDGLNVLVEFADRKDAIYFIDPPYTAGGKNAGRRLYKYHQVDHDYLFRICSLLSGDFLMTYSDAKEVQEMARQHRFQVRSILMKNTHHATMRELVIGRDLRWLDPEACLRQS